MDDIETNAVHERLPRAEVGDSLGLDGEGPAHDPHDNTHGRRRRKRALYTGASVAIVLGIAAGIGIAVSNKPASRGSSDLTAPQPAGDEQEIVDASSFGVDVSSTLPEVEVPGLESTEKPDEFAGGHEVGSLENAVHSSSPGEIEEDNDGTAVVIDDPTFDTVVDVGYEYEPEDIAYGPREDGGMSSDKVKVDGDEFDTVLADFDGPLSEFIVTSELSRITVSSNSQCTNPDEGFVRMDITTDDYPWENRWEMVNPDGEVEAFGPPGRRETGFPSDTIAFWTNFFLPTLKSKKTQTMPAGLVTLEICVSRRASGHFACELFYGRISDLDFVRRLNYSFRYDKSGDGICCSYGNGKFLTVCIPPFDIVLMKLSWFCRKSQHQSQRKR